MKSKNQSIQVRNLTKKFGDLTVVNNISFSVDCGETFAFLGPNGAGKTTTIKMLTTLLRPTTGTIFVNGYDTRTNQDSVRRSFGIVFQDQSLDEELTAYENMQFLGVLYKVPKAVLVKKIEEVLIFIELWNRKNDLVKHFSGGMKRRLEIGCELLHTPKVLFMDEPTAGLDPQTRNRIWNYLKDLTHTADVTIFFTTHNIDEAERVADRVAIIDHGRIIAEGNPEDLKKNTQTKSLEEAFLSLTGRNIREEEASGIEEMRKDIKMWEKK